MFPCHDSKRALCHICDVSISFFCKVKVQTCTLDLRASHSCPRYKVMLLLFWYPFLFDHPVQPSLFELFIFHYLSGSHTTTNHHPGSSSSPATDSGHTTSHASPTGPGQPTESATDSRSPGGCHATDPGGSADTGAHAATDSDAVAADGTTNSTGKMN